MQVSRYLALATLFALSVTGCGDRQTTTETEGEAPAERVTKEQLKTYLDWADEMQNQMIAGIAEARQTMNDNEAYMAMFERRRKEQTEILAREPFKGSPKGRAIAGVIDRLYLYGKFERDEKELDKLRAVHGDDVIDSILDHEAMIREKLDPDGLHAWARPLHQ